MKKHLLLILCSVFLFADSNKIKFEKNKDQIIQDIKLFKKEIKPFVSNELIETLSEMEVEIKREMNQDNIDLISLIYLDFQNQLFNKEEYR